MEKRSSFFALSTSNEYVFIDVIFPLGHKKKRKGKEMVARLRNAAKIGVARPISKRKRKVFY